MIDYEKFRPKMNDRSRMVYRAILKDSWWMNEIHMGKEIGNFEIGYYHFDSYSISIDAAIDDMSDRLGINLSNMDKLNIRGNIICDEIANSKKKN